MQRLPVRGLVLSGRAVGVLAGLGWAATVHIRDRLARATKKLPAGDPGLTARRAAVAAAGGARLMLRWATVTALLCSTAPRAALSVAQRRREELAWCLATVVLAAGTGLLVAAWLNGA
jgi:hypothetical protein